MDGSDQEAHTEAGSRGAAWAALILLIVATLTSGAFLLTPTDLHLPRCSEPYDAAIYPWNLFWFQEAWTATDGGLLTTERFCYPVGDALTLYTPTFGYGVLGWPFLALGEGPESGHAAVAFLLWFASAATAWLGYLLARGVGCGVAGATVASAFFVLASGRLMNAARLNLFGTEFLLLALCAGWWWWRRGGAWRAAAFGLALTVLLWQSQPLLFQFGLCAMVVAGAALFTRAGRGRWRSRWRSGFAAAGVFFVLGGPFLWSMVQSLSGSLAMDQGARLAFLSGLDLGALIVPSTADRFYGEWLGARLPSFYELCGEPGSSVSHFLGFAPLALLVIGLASRVRGAWAAIGFALAVFVLAIGPRVCWLGQPVAPGPYLLLRWLPLVQLSKSPERLVLLVQLGVALSLGAIVHRAWCCRSAWVRGGAVALAVVGLVEAADVIPLRSLSVQHRVPAEIAAIAEEPGDFAVLDLPCEYSGHLSHRVDAVAMALGAAHRRPIFFALYPRASGQNFSQLFETTQLFPAIRLADMAIQFGQPPPPLSGDLAGIRAELDGLGVRYVFVHELADANDKTRQEAAWAAGAMRSLEPASEVVAELSELYRVRIFRFD